MAQPAQSGLLSALEQALQAVGGAVGGAYNNVFNNPGTTAHFRDPTNQTFYTGDIAGGAKQAQPSPIASAAPASATPQGGNFQYVMGQNDYSGITPQVIQALKGTPLEPYANNFIQAGNKYGVDPRVLLTIANNESSMGRNYPQDSYNPFGYNAGGAGYVTGPDGKQYVNVDQGLRDAGFQSIPHAIDALTGRFARQPTAGYQQFYKNPTIQNLQQAYNANPAEASNYVKNSQALISQFSTSQNPTNSNNIPIGQSNTIGMTNSNQ